jgi:hypothetical protein
VNLGSLKGKRGGAKREAKPEGKEAGAINGTQLQPSEVQTQSREGRWQLEF